MRPSEWCDLSDPRLAAYANVRQTNAMRHSGRFIAEGRLVVERLIASDYPVESVLVEAGTLPSWLESLPASVPIFAVPKDQLSQLVGFHFHRGVMACGLRKPLLLADELEWDRVPFALAVLGVSEPENLGSMLRSAAAMGVQHVLVGPATIDPFSRRVLRVSMANALKLRFYDLPDPSATLRHWGASGRVRTLATTLHASAKPIESVVLAGQPVLLMMGNEAQGLSPDVLEAATDRVTIPMQLGADSLNVAVAAAIFLYELSYRRGLR